MPGFWRKCRITFRWFRFTVWFIALVVLGALAWFNQIGLPDFLKTRLVATLHQRGVDLEFTRMRLRFVHGLVAETVRIGPAESSDHPAFTAGEVQLRLNYPALLHRHWQVDGLILRNGKFSLPVSPTNALVLLNLQTDLRFLENDTWSLDQFRADFSGVTISLSGSVAHAPEMANWKMFTGKTAPDRSALQPLLKDFADTLERIRFDGQPQLSVTLDGDARDVHSFTLRLNTSAAGVRTPWFAARELQAAVSLTAPASAPTNSDAARGFWTNAQPFRLVWTARAANLRGAQLSGDAVECAGVWRAPELAVTRFSAKLGGGRVAAAARLDVATREVTFTNNSDFDVHALATLLPEKLRGVLAEISWKKQPVLRANGAFTLPAWTNFAANRGDEIWPTARLHGELAFTNAVARGVALDFVRTHFSYTNLIWTLPDLELARGKTRLKLSGDANEATGNFHCSVSGPLDLKSVRPFLTASNVLRAFDNCSFNTPLALALDVRGNLNHFDQLAVAGGLALTNVAVRANPFASEMALDRAQTEFTYTNNSWTWTDLELVQGKTRLDFNGAASADTEDFYSKISGAFDLASVRPFLTTSNAADGFGILTTTEPLALALGVRGSLHALENLTATGRVALTNFAVRQQTIESVAGQVVFADGVLHFVSPEMRRAQGTQKMTADQVVLDFNSLLLSFTNGFSTADPVVLVTAIGPKTAALMEPYHFLKIPTARVNGCLPLRDMNDPQQTVGTDLRFDIVEGVPFQWLKLNPSSLTGTIHWLGPELILTNLQAELYGGTGVGDAYFDFRVPHDGADYRFTVAVTNINLHQFATEVASPTNRLEGTVAGKLVVTFADTRDVQSWDGFGALQLHDGLLWDIPIFSILSPLLNAFSPGLGNSRASDATGHFTMTNGVIYSDSLEIRSTMMRLSYTGTTVLREGKVNAHVTAHPLRDTWMVGPLLSTLLWPVSKIFECQVTGTLDNPIAKPILLPARLLLVPLHPFRTVKDFFAPPPLDPPPK